MDTLLELYDEQERINNIIGIWHLQPRTIIFFYFDLPDAAAERRKLAQLLEKAGLRCNVRMEKLERFDMDDMLSWVQEHRQELGNYAIELTGGNDEMIFAAGCCYERFPCPLYCFKPNGRYVELPSGRTIQPRRGVLTVERRLALNDCTTDYSARLDEDELTPALLTLANRMLELQRRHSRPWTGHTRCFQQCVSRAPEHALTVLLDRETCTENGVTTGRGKLLPLLKTAGAITDISENAYGIEVTFPNEIVRDCLCDYGVWLEICVYEAIVNSGEFDDVRLSCVVHWENENLINELDVVATAGIGMLVVSCKTNAPDIKAIAELNVLSERVGSSHTKAMLVALPKADERLDNIHARCEEMDVQLVDLRLYDKLAITAFFKRVGMRLRAGKI